MIKNEFIDALRNYTADANSVGSLWHEIEMKYSSHGRYYHNLAHLNSITTELLPFKKRFTNWATIVFAITYHDIIYNTLKNNNEEKSAAFAVNRLSEMKYSEEQINFCRQLILATKTHQAGNKEMNLFTDADLSILGADQETYRVYTTQIRDEYSIYPDFVYNPGRKKVLHHFLEMTSIYKSPEFAEKYEATARINMQEELNSL